MLCPEDTAVQWQLRDCCETMLNPFQESYRYLKRHKKKEKKTCANFQLISFKIAAEEPKSFALEMNCRDGSNPTLCACEGSST